jgi:hypothetical protein
MTNEPTSATPEKEASKREVPAPTEVPASAEQAAGLRIRTGVRAGMSMTPVRNLRG